MQPKDISFTGKSRAIAKFTVALSFAIALVRTQT